MILSIFSLVICHPYPPFLVKCPLKFLPIYPFITELSVLLSSCKSSLHILDTKSLIRAVSYKYSLPVHGLACHFLNSDVQRANILNFDEIQLLSILQFVVFVSYVNLSFIQSHKIFSCVFFYKFDSFTFWSMVPSKLIFIPGVRLGLRFTFACEYPLVVPFVQKTILSPIELLGTFVEQKLPW